MNQMDNKYDLADRTCNYGKSIIRFCRDLKKDVVSQPIIVQLVRSGTSIGANYMEANGASSKKDFRNKIAICKKEAQETKHWIIMLEECYPEKNDECRKLFKEAQELTLIFQKITNSLNN
jgi:four helix bundle protein